MTYALHARGYTLVELIVSVAIFSIVMLVAGAAFLTLISLDRTARATNDVVTNLSYVTESMERSIRTGTNYSSTWGGSSFSFTDSEGRSVSYSLQLSGNRGSVQQCIDSTCLTLTDPRVDVENLTFYVRGNTAGDAFQPFVVFTTHGQLTPSPNSPTVTFSIESAAAQRLIDL